MPYNDEFYEQYQCYLQEKIVRQNHDFVFNQFAKIMEPTKYFIVDLGCGIGEYAAYGKYCRYAGIDLNEIGNIPEFVQGDYHNLALLKLRFFPTAFVSLFSTECFHPIKKNYEFYNQVFIELPSVRCGLVSGFFYKNRHEQESVEETGDIVSYQTLEKQSDYISESFYEFRLYLGTPSKMFGDDVIEVWKIFVRR